MTPAAQPVPPAAPGARRASASLARRCAAAAYEGLLLAAIVLLVGFLTMPLVSPVTRSAHALEVPPLPARALSACLVFGAAGLYFVWSWTGGRRTLPMKTWRLALERTDGRPVDARTAVTRYIAAWIGPLASLARLRGIEAGDRSPPTRCGSSRSTTSGRWPIRTGNSCTTGSPARGS